MYMIAEVLQYVAVASFAEAWIEIQAFGGKYLYVSFVDLIDNNKKQTVTKTGEEIAADVIKKAGLVVMSD